VVAAAQLDQFIATHGLPGSFRETVADAYEPLARWVGEKRWPARPPLLGINGAQGTGKSTLAAYLDVELRSVHDWNVAVLSIDDFYLTKKERQSLAVDIHPLFATRGVPGTHDLNLLEDCLLSLRKLRRGERCRLPRFDKATDDRADSSTWPVVSGPLDLVILEGWCVGSVAQPDDDLLQPVNDLERLRDANAVWRRHVNARLASDYSDLFSKLDALVFLQAPGFDAILSWRLEQERKLAETAPGDTPGVMDDEQIVEFIGYFERITRNNLAVIRSNADIVLELDGYHRCVASHYRT
jgi:D-glycerate 3-kinase